MRKTLFILTALGAMGIGALPVFLVNHSFKENKPEWPSQKEAYRAWRVKQSNAGMLDQPVTGSPNYSFYPTLASGFYQPQSNTVVVMWHGSNIFTFKGKLIDANLYGPTNAPTYMDGFRDGRNTAFQQVQRLLKME